MIKKDKPNKCKVCKKHLATWNKSNLCNFHYIIDHHRKQREILRKKKLCFNCRGPITPIKDKHGKLKYRVRCEKCRIQQKAYLKKYRQLKKLKLSLKGD